MKDEELILEEIEASHTLGGLEFSRHRGVETCPEVARGEGSGEGVDALSYQTRLDQSRGCKGCFEVDIS
jgi:hypothetical protein